MTHFKVAGVTGGLRPGLPLTKTRAHWNVVQARRALITAPDANGGQLVWLVGPRAVTEKDQDPAEEERHPTLLLLQVLGFGLIR